jgi:small subunit ribosomal protein S3
MGTQIVLKAEKPGMVIGKGGKNIRKVTRELEERFDLDDPQIDVQEVDEPDLNARIVADRLANALERGWYFRKAGHTTIDRIMEAGALGAEIVLSGKVTGARSRVEKFNRGYIKHNGEPAEEIVDEGQGVAVMKLGTIGVTVKIIPPGAELPDDFHIEEDVEVEAVEQVAETGGESVEELLTEEPEDVPDFSDEDVEVPTDEPDEVLDEEDIEVVDEEEIAIEEEVVEEDVDAETGPAETAPEDPDADEAAAEAAAEEALDEEVEAEAADLVAEMEAADDEDEDEDADADEEEGA